MIEMRFSIKAIIHKFVNINSKNMWKQVIHFLKIFKDFELYILHLYENSTVYQYSDTDLYVFLSIYISCQYKFITISIILQLE